MKRLRTQIQETVTLHNQIRQMRPANLLFAALHELNEVREKHIPVPLAEAVNVVRHLKHQLTYELRSGGQARSPVVAGFRRFSCTLPA